MTGEAPGSEIERLFGLALAHERGERAAFLEQACSDPAMRSEVESLLVADEQAGRFLELPPPADAHDPQIGPYRLIRKLGEGETSSVYLAARDDDQYDQRVAIKLIRPGMDSRQILQRFHQERQILASLSHPNIARLLDGGCTPAGQPYFVMEYVDGQPLDVHCQDENVPLTRRLELFGLVCQAVHFAHRNLVVHRDLKPGNILVDRDGTPKLVDFGIAKLLDPERAGMQVEPTETVARLMTPHYASPEQVQGKPVSTATDVYSLGVVLYKLLTGRRPYEFESQSLYEIERVVCETMPAPPSQVLRARRDRLPRDLDNIVLMAMRKEPERRYASAQELADDVRRCLEHRPVLARRDTLGYRASSFVRRNAGAVAAAAVIFLSVFGGAVATTWQWRRAVAERTRAETQRMTAEQTLQFVVDLFNSPESGDSVNTITARELLERGAGRLNEESQQPVETRAALKHTLGVVYRKLGDNQQAAKLLDEAATARERIPGGELDLAESLYQLGSIAPERGQAQLGERALRRALEIRTRLLGADDLSVADVLEALAANVGYKIPIGEAEDDSRRALDIRRRHFAATDLRLVPSIVGLASVYSVTGRYDEADALFDEAMALRHPMPAGQPCPTGDDTLLSELGNLRFREGYYVDAERYTNMAIACAERALGPDHFAVADLMIIRFRSWCELGRYGDAEVLAGRNFINRRTLHGDDSPAVDSALHHLAHVLYERGKLREAEDKESEALARRLKLYGDVHASVATSRMSLGDIQLASGDPRAAESSYQDAIAVFQTTLGEDHPNVAEAMRGLAESLAAQDRLVDARAAAEQALAMQRRRLRPGHPAIAGTLVTLGIIAEGESAAAAEPRFRDALRIWHDALPADHPYIGRAESLLGETLVRQHRTAEGLPLLRHGLAALQAALPDHDETRRAGERMHRAESPPPWPGAR